MLSSKKYTFKNYFLTIWSHLGFEPFNQSFLDSFITLPSTELHTCSPLKFIVMKKLIVSPFQQGNLFTTQLIRLIPCYDLWSQCFSHIEK